jgi:NAD(P)H dehydrogenase (quinone)
MDERNDRPSRGSNMKILIVDGHPYDKSFCQAVTTAYTKGATSANHQVDVLSLRELKFNPNLQAGYKIIQELEPDLLRAQDLLKNCDHLVFVSPIWWGGPPALLKGFMDRTFLPGFAFKYRKDSVWWDKFFTGKSGRVIVTSDAPAWYMRFYRGDSTVRMIKESTFDFIGIKPVRVTRLGDIKRLSDEKRLRMLQKVEKIGSKES